MEHLFVYGTLLKHFNNEVTQPIKPYLQLRGVGVIKGELYDLGEYPGYIQAEDGYDVHGEIFQVQEPQKVFDMLDEYEGYEYIRKRIPVQLQRFESLKCWVYVYQHEPDAKHEKIINGDYLAFVRNKVNNG